MKKTGELEFKRQVRTSQSFNSFLFIFFFTLSFICYSLYLQKKKIRRGIWGGTLIAVTGRYSVALYTRYELVSSLVNARSDDERKREKGKLLGVIPIIT